MVCGGAFRSLRFFGALVLLVGPLLITGGTTNNLMVDPNVDKYLTSIRSTFEKAYPTELPPGRPASKSELQTIHDQRCFLQENAQVVEYFTNNLNKNTELGRQSLPILAATPCLGFDSLGNNLAAYFENVVCANVVGLHYYSLAHIWEPSTSHQPSHFLQSIPDKIIHPQPLLDSKVVRAKVKTSCKCQGSCHERPLAAWVKGLDIIRPIFDRALRNHLAHVDANSTVVRKRDLSTAAEGATLPLIPEAAIHYRCGDNFVTHYGFLPFRAFSENIPANVSTLYVLAEERDRKTVQRPHLAAKCDALFPQLFAFLKEKFPRTTILIRRGDDLHTDMARLTYAKHVVCSVSTFCLWPAVANPHPQHVFFPRSKLVVGGRTDIQLGFQWLLDPPVVLGRTVETLPPAAFVKTLAQAAKP